MKLKEIAAYLGTTAAVLADLMGTTPQALNNYTSGRKGRPSKFIRKLLMTAGLNREEIIFPDRFEHPDGENPESPAYWANVALEALHEAVLRGIDENKAAWIANEIRAAITPTLDEIGG